MVPVYTMRSPILLLISPMGLSSLYKAVMESSAGNAYSRIRSRRITFLPGNFFLENT